MQARPSFLARTDVEAVRAAAAPWPHATPHRQEADFVRSVSKLAYNPFLPYCLPTEEDIAELPMASADGAQAPRASNWLTESISKPPPQVRQPSDPKFVCNAPTLL